MGLRHGARQLLDEIAEHEDAGFDLLALAIARLKYNPDFSKAKIEEATDRFKKARKIRDEELPGMLQKAAPNLEQRVKAIEERLGMNNVSQFKREA